MDFRLVYRGPLKSNGNPEDKQKIRRVLHPQLAELWKQLPLGGAYAEKFLDPNPGEGKTTLVSQHRNFQFVPLVSECINLICHLDILFLRREEPGSVITQGGDIDNRLKTLLDALRMPKNKSELPPEDAPGPDEKPFFYCLLEDDNLVTRIGITTDRLLEPEPNPDKSSDVCLIIYVAVKTTRLSYDNIGLSG